MDSPDIQVGDIVGVGIHTACALRVTKLGKWLAIVSVQPKRIHRVVHTPSLHVAPVQTVRGGSPALFFLLGLACRRAASDLEDPPAAVRRSMDHTNPGGADKFGEIRHPRQGRGPHRWFTVESLYLFTVDSAAVTLGTKY